MIRHEITYQCRTCGSTKIVKNGTNKCGNPQYHCKECGAYRVLEPQVRYTPQPKATILRACRERVSSRGLQRIFGVGRRTVLRWVREHVYRLPLLIDTLLPAHPQDVLEMDEQWTFVGNKDQERWLWTALCRRTRQIVGFAIGDRSASTRQQLWQRVPAE